MIQQSDKFVPKPNRTIPIAIASISALFIIFIAILWAAGFFKFSGSDPSSKIVAAALALVGGLVAAVVSIVGILLKYSIDQRTESRLQIESARAAAEHQVEADRASALQTQAELRLNLEASLRAVELLGSPKGETAALQRAGALYALSSLSQYELAIDLASYLLERGKLEPKVACTLIDRAIKSSDQNVQNDAVMMLYENAEGMLTTNNVSVPDCISNWDAGLTPFVREWAPLALSKILLSRPLSVWKTHFPYDANGFVAVLGLAWESESDERLKACVGAMLKSVLAAFPDLGFLYHPKKTIDTNNLITQVAGCSATSSVGLDIVNRLEKWRAPAGHKASPA
jgi:hypothetical protein